MKFWRRLSRSCLRRQVIDEAPLKALLVDSWYDAYRGVMTLVRVRDGVLKKGMKIRMLGTGATHVVERVGVFSPKPTRWMSLVQGRLVLSMPA